MKPFALPSNLNFFVCFRSMILSTRPKDDDSKDGFTKWPFMTTHTWAENPRGKWILEVSIHLIGIYY